MEAVKITTIIIIALKIFLDAIALIVGLQLKINMFALNICSI